MTPTASWLADIGGDAAGTIYEPAIVARAHLRYDEAKADLVHDIDHDIVVFPLDANIDPSRSANVAFGEADLLTAAPAPASYRLTDAPVGDAKTWKQVERGIIDHLVRSGSIELQVNKELKLFSAPGRVRRSLSGALRPGRPNGSRSRQGEPGDEARGEDRQARGPARGRQRPGERRRRAGGGP